MTRSISVAAFACLGLMLTACGGSGGDSSSGVAVVTGSGTSGAPATTLISGAPTLVLNVAGTTQGKDYDTLKVAGRATLSGNLQLHFTDGFKPASGQTFVAVTAAGGITGRFDAVNLDGIAYRIAYDATTATITIT